LIREKASIRKVGNGREHGSLATDPVPEEGDPPRIDTIVRILDYLGYELQIVESKSKQNKQRRVRQKGEWNCKKGIHQTRRIWWIPRRKELSSLSDNHKSFSLKELDLVEFSNLSRNRKRRIPHGESSQDYRRLRRLQRYRDQEREEELIKEARGQSSQISGGQPRP